jgi:general secretion pathway protein G
VWRGLELVIRCATVTSRTNFSSRGVTRLELVALIAGLLALASIGVPAFEGYLLRARVSRAVSDIGTMSLALHRWQQDHDTLPTALVEAGISGTDPWGRPYVYVRVADVGMSQRRQDGKRAPLNTDFDLYSRGADGESAVPLTEPASRDDVVRARDGSYIGLAVNY